MPCCARRLQTRCCNRRLAALPDSVHREPAFTTAVTSARAEVTARSHVPSFAATPSRVPPAWTCSRHCSVQHQAVRQKMATAAPTEGIAVNAPPQQVEALTSLQLQQLVLCHQAGSLSATLGLAALTQGLQVPSQGVWQQQRQAHLALKAMLGAALMCQVLPVLLLLLLHAGPPQGSAMCTPTPARAPAAVPQDVRAAAWQAPTVMTRACSCCKRHAVAAAPHWDILTTSSSDALAMFHPVMDPPHSAAQAANGGALAA